MRERAVELGGRMAKLYQPGVKGTTLSFTLPMIVLMPLSVHRHCSSLFYQSQPTRFFTQVSYQLAIGG